MFKADPLMLVQESLARVNEIRKEFLICIELSIVNDSVQISSIASTRIYINLEIEEVAVLRQRLLDEEYNAPPNGP
ncbi:hypothetical protein AgCh_039134 [Apium graveolens]